MPQKKKILMALIRAPKGVGGAETLAMQIVKSLADKYEFYITYNQHALIAQEFIHAGARLCPIEIKSKVDFISVFKIRRYISKNKIDLIHSNQPALDWVSAFISLVSKKPLIITRHSDISGFVHRPPLVKKIFQIADLFSLLVAKSIITVSEYGLQCIKKYALFTGTRAVCINNAIEITESSSNADAIKHCPVKKNVVGVVAQMTVDKGYDVLIKAAKIVVDKLPDTTFLAVGDGPELAEIYKNIKSCGITDNFKLVGYQKDVIPFYKLMDVVVLTSKREGMPMVLLEAMLMSKPVIATAVGGVPELIENGKSGFLCDKDDYNGIANKIILLLSDMNLRVNIGNAANKRIKDKFSVQNMADAYDREYKIALNII